VEKKRYADAVLFNMPESFTMNIERAKIQVKKGDKDDATAALVRYTIASSAKRIEALAGAGDLATARDLMAKLLELDASDETKALLQTHLTRAGHPELLTPPLANH
jgi:hypothetical protein